MAKGPPAIVIMEVSSSRATDKNHEVRISRTDGKMYCTCAGWRFKKHCAHLDIVTKEDILEALENACKTGVLGI